MKKIFYTALYCCSALLMSSCLGDLDQFPHEEETSSTIYTSAENYKAVLGKMPPWSPPDKKKAATRI